jgi:hypothetical protein
MLKALPAVLGLVTVSKVKWSKAAGATLKELEVPDLPEPVAVIVFEVLAPVTVTEKLLSTPLEKLVVTMGEIVPVRSLRFTVPLKPVTVLLLAS